MSSSTQLSAQRRCCWLTMAGIDPIISIRCGALRLHRRGSGMTAPYLEDFTAMMGTLLE